MNIILSGDLDPCELESYRNLLRIFVSAGHQCSIWFKNQKSVFDVWDETKPQVYIGRELTAKEEACCKQYDTMFVKSLPILAADVHQYAKAIEPSDIDKMYFETEYCSIINHKQSELVNLNGFINKNLRMKIFSPFNYVQTEYCGDIPQELYVTALSCCEVPLASNFLNMYNFTLLNPKTIYPVYSMTESYPRDRILDEHTSFSCAKSFIEDNKLQDLFEMDVDAMYSKFRNENKI